jgi:hypothetical protein
MAAAARMRLIEYHIPGIATKFEGKSPYDRFFSLYGVLGRRWLQHILNPVVRARFLAHLQNVDFSGFRAEARFIVKFAHMLKWVVEESAYGNAGIIEFNSAEYPDFAAHFEATQKASIEEARGRRAVTPAQKTILTYLTKYRDKSLTFALMPNGRTPDVQRVPLAEQLGTNAYQHGTAMWIEVQEPDVICIPMENLSLFYKETIRDRNYTSEMQQLINEKSLTIAKNVQILGNKDKGKKPNCYVLPRSVLQSWEMLAAQIIEGYQPLS